MRNTKLHLSVASLLLLVYVAPSVNAANLYLDADFGVDSLPCTDVDPCATLAFAVNNSGVNDPILLLTGVHLLHEDLPKRPGLGNYVAALNPATGPAIIDCQGHGGFHGDALQLHNITMRNCSRSDAAGAVMQTPAPGINPWLTYGPDQHMVITNCRFEDCSGSTETSNGFGGAVGVYGGGIWSPRVINNTFVRCHNPAPDGGMGGGGLAIGDVFEEGVHAVAEMLDNTFINCTARGDGGGAWIAPRTVIRTDNNEAVGCSADSRGGGFWLSNWNNILYEAEFPWNNFRAFNCSARYGGGAIAYEASGHDSSPIPRDFGGDWLIEDNYSLGGGGGVHLLSPLRPWDSDRVIIRGNRVGTGPRATENVWMVSSGREEVELCGACEAPSNCDPAVGCLRCGDGILSSKLNEVCDDGNNDVETCPEYFETCSVCVANCTFGVGVAAACNDGVLQLDGEECEPTVALPIGGCTEECEISSLLGLYQEPGAQAVVGAAVFASILVLFSPVMKRVLCFEGSSKSNSAAGEALAGGSDEKGEELAGKDGESTAGQEVARLPVSIYAKALLSSADILTDVLFVYEFAVVQVYSTPDIDPLLFQLMLGMLAVLVLPLIASVFIVMPRMYRPCHNAVTWTYSTMKTRLGAVWTTLMPKKYDNIFAVLRPVVLGGVFLAIAVVVVVVMVVGLLVWLVFSISMAVLALHSKLFIFFNKDPRKTLRMLGVAHSVETALEAIPQLVLQVWVVSLTGSTPIRVASLIVSGLMILDTVWKCCYYRTTTKYYLAAVSAAAADAAAGGVGDAGDAGDAGSDLFSAA